MRGRIGNFIFISPESNGVCELCGVVAETRPYGPSGEEICFECGEKDKLGTEIQMNIKLFGDTPEKAYEHAVASLGLPDPGEIQ